MPADRHVSNDEIRRLTRGLEALEERVARLEQGEGAATPGTRPGERDAWEEPPPTADDVLMGVSRSPQYIGRLFLVMGGAYLLRSLTAGGGVPGVGGVAVGAAYGLLWIGVGARAARRGDSYAASWYAFAAAGITLPLIWETSVRYGVLPPAWSGALLALCVVLAVTAAWRYRLASMARVFVAGGGICALLLMEGVEGNGAPFAVAMTMAGGVTLWAGRDRNWRGLIAVSALFADLAVLVFVLRTLADPGSVPSHVIAVPLLLFAVYAGSITLYAVRGWWPVAALDVAQTAVVLAVGYGEALHIAQRTSAAALPLGVATSAVALGVYLAAFTVLDRERHRCFYYVTSIALVLVLAGSASLIERPSLPWTLLAVATVVAGTRLQRASLILHAALYSGAAVVASGLFALAADGWLHLPPDASAGPTPLGWFALAGLVLCAGLPVFAAPRVTRGFRWIPPFLSLTLLVWAVGGLLLRAMGALVTSGAWLTTGRTGAIAALVLATAAIAQRRRLERARFLVHALLVAGALEILLEDLPAGTPASLSVSFVVYGTVLMLGHRLARSAARQATTDPDPGEP